MLILANVSEVHAQISTTVSPIASITTAYTNSTLATLPYVYQKNNGTPSPAVKVVPPIASYHGSGPKYSSDSSQSSTPVSNNFNE